MISQAEINGSIDLIVETFKGFRPELMQHFGKIKHLSKTNDSPVTELDVRVESVLKARLTEQFSRLGFQGEETEAVMGTSGATWFVDPIDGTSCFIHGLPFCTNMAGLVVDGEPVAGIIYDFVNDVLYTTIKGQGAYRDGVKLALNNQPLNNSLVYADRASFINTNGILFEYKINSFAPIGASGYYYTMLAEGKIHGVMKLRSISQVHDNVAGVLLAREAGADVLSFEAGELSYDTLRFVIGTPNFIEVAKLRKADIEAAMISNNR